MRSKTLTLLEILELPFTDGAYIESSSSDASFPSLKAPIPGSP